MENSRSNRAVQREDVWAAADALLLDGKRPTIERVRQTIGRGSPNTVSPMLEEWFATLGPRMAQLKASGGVVIAGAEDAVSEAGQGAAAIPQALAQAMQGVWDGALTQAREAADAELANERARLQAQQAELDDAQQALQQAEALWTQQRASLEQALAVAHSQIKLQGARLGDLELAAKQKDEFAAQQQQRLQALELELFASRKARDDADKAHAEQLRELQSAAQAQQHRALQEVDRARQEIKQWMAAQRAEQEKLAKLEGDWLAERKGLQQQLDEGAQQLAAAQAQSAQVQQSLQSTAEQHRHQQALAAEQYGAQLAQLQWQLEQWRQKAAAGQGDGVDAAANEGAKKPLRPSRSLAQSARAARSLRKR